MRLDYLLFTKAILLIALTNFTAYLFGQQNRPFPYPPKIEDAVEEIYKTKGEVELKVWIFNPPDHNAGSNTPAIVFFFGGGWRNGSPAQFQHHCEYLAARGMVAILADYRVNSRHGVTAKYCVSDAKSAIRWVRANAQRLGVDPNRIVAAGGSAGGHLAASTATLEQFGEAGEDQSISCKPNALALFNPVVALADIPGKWTFNTERSPNLPGRVGTKPELISPYHHIADDMGPTIIFHGTDDTTVQYKTVELFQAKMKEKGLVCELVSYKGEGHGFFNYGRKNNGPFIDTLNKLDAFLVSINYLQAPPEVFVNK